MPPIREILAGLPAVDRATLMSAFEAGVSQYVEFAPGLFVGVNTDVVPYLIKTQEAGDFRAGTISRPAG